MTWREAIDDLETQVAEWAPEGIDARRESWSEDPGVDVLVLQGGDGRRLVLEPAWWKRDEVPTAADLYNARGPRVRLQGPNDDGGWKVLTSDLLALRVPWDREGVRLLLSDLLAA